MRLAITGGAGFLGYHLCKILSGKYDEIFVFDIAPINPCEYPSRVRYFDIDVRDYRQLEENLKGVDHLVHAAAALPLWKKKEILDININGTKNVLEAARRNRVKRVVHVSSTAVYRIPHKHPVYEHDPLSGVGPYGRSKVEAEGLCGEYRAGGMCISVVRAKTFIGRGRLGIFQVLYDWIESGKKIPVIGSGRNHYQLLEVEDLVGAVDLLLNAPPEKANDVFNIGASDFGTISEDVGALCDFAGTGARLMRVPAWLAKPLLILFNGLGISPIYQWVYGTIDRESYVSIEKVQNALNWSPGTSNAQALIRSYQWFLDNKDKLSGTGVTHHEAWKQGALAVIKRFL